MKKLMTIALATLISGNIFAADFACKAKYEDAISSNFMRIVGRAYAGTGIVSVGTVAAHATGIIATSLATGLVPAAFAVAIGTFIYEENRERSLTDALRVMNEAFDGREQTLLEAASFYHRWHNYITQEDLNTINYRRDRIGLSPMTRREYNAAHPYEGFDAANYVTEGDKLVTKLNTKLGTDYSYDEVMEKVKEIASDSKLCEKRLAGKKKFTKMVIKQIQ